MKRLALIALFAAMSLPVFAEEEAAAPAIFCAEPNHDFGTLDSSHTVVHDYIIVNKGNAPLEITQARPSCGCTVANISNKTVAPGEESRITAQLNLAGRAGPQHKTITVDSNDPKQPQLTLTLNGNIGNAVNIVPSEVTFGQMSAHDTATREIIITPGDGNPLKVLSADSSSPNIGAEIQTREDGKVYAILITTKGALTPGVINAVVHVTTDNLSRPQFDIPVNAIVNGDLIVAPMELTLADQSAELVTRYIIVRSANNEPFEIKSVEVPEAGITYQIFPFGVNGYRIQLDNIKSTRDMDGQVLKINTSVESMPQVTVPFRVVGS